MKKGLLNLLVAAFLISFSSCQKDEPQPTDYVGNWTSEVTQNDITFKEELVFTESTFENILKVPTTTGAYLDYMGLRGGISVSGNKITLTPDKAGEAEIDLEKLTIGAFVWYDKGSVEYKTLVDKLGGESISGEYEVTGNVLILKTDINRDGKYSADEITTYNKS